MSRVPLNRTVSDPDTLVSWIECTECGENYGSPNAARECCETRWSARIVQPARLAPEWAYEGSWTEQTTLTDAATEERDSA